MDEGAIRFVMATAAKKWKDFKADLKKKFFQKYKETMTEEEIMALCDERVSVRDWKWLISHWNSTKAEVRHFTFNFMAAVIVDAQGYLL